MLVFDVKISEILSLNEKINIWSDDWDLQKQECAYRFKLRKEIIFTCILFAECRKTNRFYEPTEMGSSFLQNSKEAQDKRSNIYHLRVKV